MSDLPFQALLQQAHARSVSGEELEAFGKKAAAQYSRGDGSLTEAVVETVKHAGLSPEQVKRVVEFANTTAYLTEFKKEGSPHKVVEFHGGPADPSVVLQDLNDGGGGSTYDHGSRDYSSPPKATKIASAAAEEAFVAALARPEALMPQHNPFGEIVDLRDKLASLYDTETSVLSGLEGMFMDLSDSLYGHVKQAAMDGTTLGEVVQAWAPFLEDPVYVKAAFELIGPRLVQEGVFSSIIDVDTSLSKTASGHRQPNAEHPLVVTMGEFCETLDKLAGVRLHREQTKVALDESTRFLTRATPERLEAFFNKIGHLVGLEKTAKGAWKSITDVADLVGGHAGSLGKGLGEVILGEGSQGAKSLGRVAEGAVKYAPHAAVGALALRGGQHLQAMGQTPMGQTVKSFIPGTPEYQQKSQELAYQYGGYGGLPYPTY